MLTRLHGLAQLQLQPALAFLLPVHGLAEAAQVLLLLLLLLLHRVQLAPLRSQLVFGRLLVLGEALECLQQTQEDARAPKRCDAMRCAQVGGSTRTGESRMKIGGRQPTASWK